MRKALFALFAIAGFAFAQSPRPKFEVASIKQNKSDAPQRMQLNLPNGRFVATNVALANLIGQAYRLPPSLLSQAQLRVLRIGWPEWISGVRFDIEAVAPGNPSRDQKLQMLQSLLEERFKVAVHEEDQQHPVFAMELVRAGKLGPQLRPHNDDSKCQPIDVYTATPEQAALLRPKSPDAPLPMAPCGGFTQARGRFAAQKVPLSALGSFIAGDVDQWVIDRTGLEGTFDLSLEFTPQQTQPGLNAAPDDSAGPPSMFTAIRDQLGLKFEKQIGPVPVLVIDHVEMPSEN